MKPPVLYLCYHTLTDPLVQTQVIAYLRGLAQEGYPIYLITFEWEQLSDSARTGIEQELAAAGIHWSALRYQKSSRLPTKLYNLFCGALGAFRLGLIKQIRLVHGRSHVGAAIGFPLKLFLGCRLLFDIRGLLAEEYVDVGHWTAGGLNYSLTKWFERVLLRFADGFIVLTERLKRELVQHNSLLARRASDVHVIPCCVDTKRFDAQPEERLSYRVKRGWSDRLVLTYVGKLGTWYLSDEMAAFFAAARQVDSRFFLQVLTGSDPRLMQEPLQRAGMPTDSYAIHFADPIEVAQILTASDAGLSFIKPCPSKRASSPTKVGEYLAAGLPVVANAGIGDCDLLLRDRGIGVLLAGFNQSNLQDAARSLRTLIEDSGTKCRCRHWADAELSLSEVGIPRYARVYARLIGESRPLGNSKATLVGSTTNGLQPSWPRGLTKS